MKRYAALLNLKQASEYLGIRPADLLALLDNGDIPYIRVPGASQKRRLRIFREELERFREKQEAIKDLCGNFPTPIQESSVSSV